MKITSQGKLIYQKAIHCKSILSKTIGLMFSLRAKPLLMSFSSERIVSLHTYFVFFPIDVIYMNKKKEVVETINSMRPFSYHIPKNKSQYILELPTGEIKNKNITCGQMLSWNI